MTSPAQDWAVQTARRAQTCELAVAPGHTVHSALRGLLTQGMELRRDDLYFQGGGREPVAILQALIDAGQVIQPAAAGDAPVQRTRTAARYITSTTLMTARHGVVLVGYEVQPRDFTGGQTELDELVARGVVKDTQATG